MMRNDFSTITAETEPNHCYQQTIIVQNQNEPLLNDLASRDRMGTNSSVTAP